MQYAEPVGIVALSLTGCHDYVLHEPELDVRAPLSDSWLPRLAAPDPYVACEEFEVELAGDVGIDETCVHEIVTGDLEAIVELGERMRDIMVEEGRSRGRIGNITMSINCLIPKPGTPLQWAPQIGRRAYRDKLRWLRRRAARVPNLIIDAMPPRSAEIQAVMSRGDRRVAELLEEWHRCGEWAPALRAWSTAHEVPLEEFLRQRNPLEPTPWGHLRVGPGLPALTNQWHKAMEVASETPESLATAS